MSKANGTGILLVLVAAFSWSTAGLFTRVVTTDIPTTLFWRSLFGGLCVLGIAMVVQRSADIRAAFTFGRGEAVIATLSTAGMICFISAFFHTTIANVAFVYGTMPLVTFMLSLVFLGARADAVSLGCCVLSAAGVAVMASGNSLPSDFLGIGLACGMTLFMASLTVAAKFFPDADSTKATYLSAFLGALATAPFATFGHTSTADYLWLLLYGFVNVGVGFGVYLIGVKRVSALVAALVGLTEIPLAPVWAWILFGEGMNLSVLIGGAVILTAAVLYIARSERNAGEADDRALVEEANSQSPDRHRNESGLTDDERVHGGRYHRK